MDRQKFKLKLSGRKVKIGRGLLDILFDDDLEIYEKLQAAHEEGRQSVLRKT